MSDSNPDSYRDEFLIINQPTVWQVWQRFGQIRILKSHMHKTINVGCNKMKTLNFILLLLLLTACNNKQSKTRETVYATAKDTVIQHDTIIYAIDDWQQSFGLTYDPEVDSIWGKPVKFYIDNPQCSPIAIEFYNGRFRPTDNDATAALLKLIITNDNKLRPFYRWCLNKTIQIQDGALGEYTGLPARQYAERFPKEFFEYMDSDTTGDKYLDWVNSILYSGFYDKDDYKKPQDIRKRMTQTMNKNCGNCTEQLKNHIDKFARDCFP